ncbi:MAG: hypothetical protein ACUVRS_09795 [Armatimonadota bacterium]
MYVNDPKRYLGMNVAVTYRDQHGHLHMISFYVTDVTYCPLHGGYLVSGQESIRLDQITHIVPIC